MIIVLKITIIMITRVVLTIMGSIMIKNAPDVEAPIIEKLGDPEAQHVQHGEKCVITVSFRTILAEYVSGIHKEYRRVRIKDQMIGRSKEKAWNRIIIQTQREEK